MTEARTGIELLWRRISENALPFKLVIGAIVSIITGPGLLGFVSEYATYRYALYYGFRPPLEGIPYLRAAVTLWSFMLLSSAAVLFIASLWVIKRMVFLLPIEIFGDSLGIERMEANHMGPRRVKRLERTTAFRDLPLKKVAIRAMILASLLGVLTMAISLFMDWIWPEPAVGYRMVPFSLAYGFIATFLVWRRELSWWFASICTTLAVCMALAVMFHAPTYAKFLRFIGYGGGLPVRMHLETEGGVERTFEGYLLLRTGEAVITLEGRGKIIREVPYSRLISFEHAAVPFADMRFSLPPKRKSS